MYAIRVEALTKRYGETLAVDAIDCAVLRAAKRRPFGRKRYREDDHDRHAARPVDPDRTAGHRCSVIISRETTSGRSRG